MEKEDIKLNNLNNDQIKFDKNVPNHLEILKPTLKDWVITRDDENNIIGNIEIKLAPLMGLTLLHPLRRITLGFVPCYSVAAIKVSNNNHSPLHIFASVTGILEDLPYIHANIKKIKIKVNQIDEEVPPVPYFFLSLVSNKVGPVYARDIFIDNEMNKYFTLEIINPDDIICHLDVGSNLRIDMLFRRGFGYASEDANQKYFTRYLIKSLREGWFYIGTQFSNGIISFTGTVTEMTGGTIAYDSLNITIKTDGRIEPKDVLYNSFEILYQQIPFSFEKVSYDNNDQNNENNLSHEKYNVSLKTLGLQHGTINQLERNSIFTLRDLLQQTITSLKLLRGFGNTRLKDVVEKLSNLGYDLKN